MVSVPVVSRVGSDVVNMLGMSVCSAVLSAGGSGVGAGAGRLGVGTYGHG